MKTKMSLRKIMVFVVAILMVMTLVPGEARASAEIVGSGQMGDNVYWTIDTDCVLTVSGTGPTWDCIYYTHEWDVANVWGADGRVKQYLPTSIVIEDGVTYLGDWLFSMLDRVTSVKMADSVIKMGESVFCDCEKLVDIKLSKNPTSITYYDFKFCQELFAIEIPDKVVSIEDGAFGYCEKLTNIVIPNSVKTIGVGVFRDCNNLSDVYYVGSEAQWKKVEINNKSGANTALLNATIHYGVDEQKDEPSAWAKAEVQSAVAAGLVPASLQQNYTGPVSRGEVAQMFINLIEKSSSKNIDAFMSEKGVNANTGAFSDTSDRAVLAANALGIINGVGSGKFDPNGTLTRAQIAAIINREARTLGVSTDGYQHNFTDVSGHWVDTELGWPVNAGVINGVGNNKFDPDAKLTTEQAIVITYRAFTALKK